MARPRNPNRDKAKEIWLESGMKKPLKDIAAELNASESQVRNWKAQDKWETQRNATKLNRCATKHEKPETVVKKNLDKVMLESAETNESLTEKQKLFCYYVASGYSDVKSYMEAYKCSYDNAKRHAYSLRKIEEVNVEISKLREIAVTCGDIPTASEVLERHAKIHYAKHSDFIDYGTEEVIDEYGRTVTKNYLHFKDPSEIDEEIISSVTLGKDGAKIELDKADALKFWTRYHGLNPMDRHKIENDNAKLELERQRLEKEIEEDNEGLLPALLEYMKEKKENVDS